MATYNEIHLVKTPLQSTSNIKKGEGKSLTPLNQVQYLMIYAFQQIFNDIRPYVKKDLTPRIVFGLDSLGNSRYLRLAEHIMHLTEFYNDKYADKKDIKNGMFNRLFTTPIFVGGKPFYLDIPQDMVYKRVKKDVVKILGENKFSFPITDPQITSLVKLFSKVYEEIIEGKKFTNSYGKKDIKPSEMLSALKHLEKSQVFFAEEFGLTRSQVSNII